MIIIGTVPIFFGAEILTATTISGTMVLGLMPVFMFWNDNANKHSFHLAVISCILIGLVYTLGFNFYNPIEGNYGDLLWVNIIGFFISLIMYKLPIYFKKKNG